MNRFLTLALALVVSGTFSGISAAQQKAEEKPRPTDQEMQQPAAGEKKTVDKISPELITGRVTGKVTAVDRTAKTFTVMIQGRAIGFSAVRLTKLPTVGDAIDINVTLNTGQSDALPLATSTAPAKLVPETDNTGTEMFIGGASRAPKACSGGSVGGGYCHCYHSFQRPFVSLNVCG